MKLVKLIALLVLLVLVLYSPPVVAQTLQFNGTQATRKLMEQSQEFRKEVIEVVPGVHVAVGYGSANSTLIEGDNGVIIVDTLEGTEGAEQVLAEFRKITSKPVKAIIYTHSHLDHIGGAKVFAEDGKPDIYARANFTSDLVGDRELSPIVDRRTRRQFGFILSPEERINLGVGPGDRPLGGFGEGFLPPNHQFDQKRLSLELVGVRLELVAAPGETDDELYVWLPDKKVLFCGDNYYKAFPNLYAIRGSSYRDVSKWADSLDTMIRENPEYLIPGHTRPISGAKTITQVLTNYRDAIRSVLAQTLEGMNNGLTPDQLVEVVKLPPELAEKPYLQEFYGTVPWTVRSIYGGYLGWFDGNPSHLFELSPVEESLQVARLAGGNEALLEAAQNAKESKDYQWAMQLADYLITLQFHTQEAKLLKADALTALAKEQMNANARNYYLSVAKELQQSRNSENLEEPEFELSSNSRKQ